LREDKQVNSKIILLVNFGGLLKKQARGDCPLAIFGIGKKKKGRFKVFL